MCRNIKTLHNFAPPATHEEIHASALQFVRKLSGFNKPSKANEAAFNKAVEDVTRAAHHLLDSLVRHDPPRNREEEAAKAKYYLMTGDFLDGKEAERIGLVSLCAPRVQLMDKALATADKLAKGAQQAIRFTKRSLNNWMRISQPAFDASLAMEMLCFLGDDAKEGVAALKEKREPKFPSAR